MNSSGIELRQRVTVSSLRRYLRTQGWLNKPLRSGETDLFAYPLEDNRFLELFMPVSGDVEGADRRVALALDTLSRMLGTTVGDIAARIRAIGFDTLRAALPTSASAWDSISLDAAASITLHAKRLLAFAATTEINPEKYSRGISDEGDRYSSRCRFGHTFRSSFGFTIDSPVGPHDDFALDEIAHPPPPERRFMQRLHKGLSVVEMAGRRSDPSLITNSYGFGFNANMCHELVRMYESADAEALTFGFAFSPEWEIRDAAMPPLVIEIRSRAIAVAKEAAVDLQERKTDPAQTIYGRVVHLGTRENPADLLNKAGTRDVAVEWPSEYGLIRVRMKLDAETYRIAYDAHGAGQTVAVTGELEIKRQSATLRSPTDFRILPYAHL